MTFVAVLMLVTGAQGVAAQHRDHQEQKPTQSEPKSTAREPSMTLSTKSQCQSCQRSFHPSRRRTERPHFLTSRGMRMRDRAWHSFVLFDQLEWQSNAGGSAFNVDTRGWVGRDRDRVWFRAEGDGEDGGVGEAEAHVLYGRQFSRWWDVVAGVRQDFEPGPSRTWAAVGVQGLAPYWFEVELTGYVGASGRTHLRGEVEYELLLTNRLVLQPLLEVDLYGKSDPERGIGAGLSTTDVGLRLRYEFKREFAPYIGVTWNNKWGQTGDFAKAAGEDTGGGGGDISFQASD